MFTFTNFLLAVTASLSVFTSSVDAASIARRDVIVPPILYPTTGTVWFVGETHNVTWDTSVVPPGFTGTGLIVLGFLEGDSINEHLDLDHPLAQGFPITAGRTNVVVPSVPEKDSYILVLFGDSGNASGKFSIRVGISSNSSTSTTAPASTSSTTATATASSASVTATPSGTTSSSASGANLPVSTTDTDSAHPTLGGSAFSTPEASGASSTASSTNTIVPPPVDTTTSPSGTASRSQSTVVVTVGTSNTGSGTAGAAQAPASTQGSGAATLRGINSISLMGFCAILGAWAVL